MQPFAQGKRFSLFSVVLGMQQKDWVVGLGCDQLDQLGVQQKVCDHRRKHVMSKIWTTNNIFVFYLMGYALGRRTRPLLIIVLFRIEDS